MTCNIVRESDEFVCRFCFVRWDTHEEQPPCQISGSPVSFSDPVEELDALLDEEDESETMFEFDVCGPQPTEEPALFTDLPKAGRPATGVKCPKCLSRMRLSVTLPITFRLADNRLVHEPGFKIEELAVHDRTFMSCECGWQGTYEMARYTDNLRSD